MAVRHYTTIDSTNKEAMRLIGSSPLPLWLCADEQTQGKGTKGREWAMPHGNLACSVLFKAECPPHFLPQLSLVAGLALYEAFAKNNLHEGLELKWANDLLLHGKKCAGILVEGSTKGKETYVVVGFGVNTKAAPLLGNRETASFNGQISAIELLETLQITWQEKLTLWGNGANFEAIRAQLKPLLWGMGKEITFITGEKAVTGMITDLTKSGALLLNVNGHLTEFNAGEIALQRTK